MEITFPPTFLWGTATAAHQVEGSNVYNDNWVMEHAPGSPWVARWSGHASSRRRGNSRWPSSTITGAC